MAQAVDVTLKREVIMCLGSQQPTGGCQLLDSEDSS